MSDLTPVWIAVGCAVWLAYTIALEWWFNNTALLSEDDVALMADAVIREINIPDRIHTDDQGRTWEWCGGQPGTWAWRITANATADE